MQIYYFCTINKKLIARIKKILRKILIAIISIPIVVIIILQHPITQNWTAKKAISMIESKINGDISVDEVMVVFFNKVILREGYIIGEKKDTLVSFEKLSISLSSQNLIKRKLKVNRLLISDGVFKYQMETGEYLSNLHRIFNIKPKGNSELPNFPNFDISELILRDFRFVLNDTKTPIDPNRSYTNFTDLSVSSINLRANNIKNINNFLSANVKDFSCEDKGGLKVEKISGQFSLGNKEARLDNLELRDGYSLITANYLYFKRYNRRDLREFIDKIELGAYFTDARLNFRSLGNISPDLQKNNLVINITGEVKGPISNMKSELLNISADETKLKFSADVSGLPDINKTVFKLNKIESELNTQGIIKSISAYNGVGTIPYLEKNLPESKFAFSGDFNGTIHNFTTTGLLTSDIGDIIHDLELSNSEDENGINISGSLSTTDLDLAKILKNDLLGEVSIDTKLTSVIKDKTEGGTSFNVENLYVHKFGLLGYDYTNIQAVGEYSEKTFDGKVISNDPNLRFLFQGVLSTSRQDQNYNFYLNVPYADLADINLDKGSKKSEISFMTVANMTNSLDTKELFGSLSINNIKYLDSTREYSIGDIHLNSQYSQQGFHMVGELPFMNIDYQGDYSPITFLSNFDAILQKQFPNIITKRTNYLDGRAQLNVDIFNSNELTEILLPDLYIADTTTIDVSLINEDILLNLNSPRLAINTFSLKDFNLKINNLDSLIKCQLESSSMSNPTILFENNILDFTLTDNNIHLNYEFKNEGDINNSLKFDSDILFTKNGETTYANIIINESNFFIQDYKWNISPTRLRIGGNSFISENLRLNNGNQELILLGKMSSSEQDTLALHLDNFDLSIVNSFLKKDLQLDGVFSGKSQFTNLLDNPSILMNITGQNVSLFNNPIGRLDIYSTWDNVNDRLNLSLVNQYLNRRPIDISGTYNPRGNFLDLNLGLRNFSLSYIEPFIHSTLSDVSGRLSGDLRIFGKLNELEINSNNTSFMDFRFTPIATKVPYTVNGPISFNSNSINLENIKIVDRHEQQATLRGTIRHNYFKKPSINASIDFNNLELLNTNIADNETFYGTAFGSGSANLTGDFLDLLLSVNLSTGDRSNIHIPISSSSSMTSQDLLSFKKEEEIKEIDPYLIFLNTRDKDTKADAKFSVKGSARINPNMNVALEINKELGNILNCRGDGLIDLDITDDIFDIRGDYTIQEGSYTFVLLNGLTSKNFLLEEGGSIVFNGDLNNTNLNLGATYQTKAAISTLISDTTSVGNRRDVNCGIEILGTLNSPILDFSIDIPDLDPLTKGQVESALSSADKIQRQFFALLLSGSFVPDERSGIVNNTTILYSNASDIIANQFNNIFRQLGIPLDLGFNYQPGTQGKGDMFDVALSYQAFNNRVIINGNVGQGANQDWLGNFEAEVKIDKSGRIRAKAFTKSADDYSNYLDNTQRSGVGFTYQSEFDNLPELLRSLFLSKRRREEIELERLRRTEQELKSRSIVFK